MGLTWATWTGTKDQGTMTTASACMWVVIKIMVSCLGPLNPIGAVLHQASNGTLILTTTHVRITQLPRHLCHPKQALRVQPHMRSLSGVCHFGSFKEASKSVYWWYRSSYGTDFDDSEISMNREMTLPSSRYFLAVSTPSPILWGSK